MAAGDSFKGTSVAAAHIGQRAHDSLAALIDDGSNEAVQLVLTPGAEGDVVAQAFDVVVQANSLGGDAVTSAVQLHARVYDANMIEGLAAAWTIDVVAGTVDSVDTQAAVVVTTTATGAATLRVTDVSAVSTADIWLEVMPVGRPGYRQLVKLTYA